METKIKEVNTIFTGLPENKQLDSFVPHSSLAHWQTDGWMDGWRGGW